MTHRAWIFDLDGTLYRQLPVRLEMAIKLGLHYAFRPWRLNELLLLREFRAARETLQSDSENFSRLRLKYDLPAEEIFNEWMIDRALPSVRRWRRQKVLAAIEKHMSEGGIAIVYSDYPVAEKLQALGLRPTHAYWSGDPIVDCLKPDARGLNNIIAELGLDRAEILYVGDRDDRDGECARRAGVAYLDIDDFARSLP